MDYPKLIKSIREELLISQTEFAELLDVTFASVKRYENGKSKPTFKAQIMLAAVERKAAIDND